MNKKTLPEFGNEGRRRLVIVQQKDSEKLASIGAGASPPNDKNLRMFPIIWFMGAAGLIYFIGKTYKLSEEIATWHEWALGVCLVGLGGSLVWAALTAMWPSMASKILKALDFVSRGIELAKKKIGSSGDSRNKDQTPGSSGQ